eukprot:1463462-Lingulodinium_polyedra.AAC.1
MQLAPKMPLVAQRNGPAKPVAGSAPNLAKWPDNNAYHRTGNRAAHPELLHVGTREVRLGEA